MLLSCFRRLLDQTGIPLPSSSAPQPSVPAALQGRAHCSHSWGGCPLWGGVTHSGIFVAVCACTSEGATCSRPSRSTDVNISDAPSCCRNTLQRFKGAPQLPPACCSLPSVWQRAAPGTLSTSRSPRPLLGFTAFRGALRPQRDTSLCDPPSCALHLTHGFHLSCLSIQIP